MHIRERFPSSRLEHKVIPQLPDYYFSLTELALSAPPSDPVSYKRWEVTVENAVAATIRTFRTYLPDFSWGYNARSQQVEVTFSQESRSQYFDQK